MKIAKSVVKDMMRGPGLKSSTTDQSIIEWVNKEAALLLNSLETTDDPSKSKTPGPGTSSMGNTPVPDKTVPQSIYETKEEMIAALVAKGLSQQAAEAAASEVFGPGNDPREGSRKLAQAKYDLTQKLVNKGFGLAQARILAADVFGENTKADWTTSTESKNVVGGGRSTTTTAIPKAGIIQQPRTKQASVAEVAPWAVAIGAREPDDTVIIDNGIRSASAVPSYYYDVDPGYALGRRIERHRELRENRDQSIKSASSTGKPSWLLAYENRGW